MLDERADALRAIVSANHQEMRRLIGGLSDADLETKTESGRNVRSASGHIAQAPAGISTSRAAWPLPKRRCQISWRSRLTSRTGLG